MNVAILFDIVGWAYHAEAKGMYGFLTSQGVNCSLFSFPDFYRNFTQEKRDEFDCVFLYPRQARPITFPVEKTVVKFSSYGTLDYVDEKVSGGDFKYVVCTSRDIFKRAIKAFPGKEHMYHFPLCIDTDVFFPKFIKHDKLTIGFAGNTKRELKRFELIEEARENTSNIVDWKIASFHGDGRIPHDKMVDYYNDLDVLITMSNREGGPLTSFESGICGIPTICGSVHSAIHEVIIDNYNGFLVDQTAKSLTEKIIWLNNNREVLKTAQQNIANLMLYNHSWKYQGYIYQALLELASKN